MDNFIGCSKRKTPRYVLRLSQVHWNKSVPVAPLIAFKCLIWACGKPDFVSRTFHFRYSYFAQITKSYKWAFFLTAQDFGVWVSCMEESAECKSSNGIFYEYVIGLVPGMHDFLYKILLSNPKRLCCLFLRGCLLFVLLHIHPKTWLGIKVQHFFSWSGQKSAHVVFRPHTWTAISGGPQTWKLMVRVLEIKDKLALMISKGGCSRIPTPIAVDLFLLDAASI